MRMKCFESIANATVGLRPGRDYDILPGAKPFCLSERDLVRLTARGALGPADDAASEELKKLRRKHADIS